MKTSRKSFDISRRLLSSLVRQWKAGVTDYTYDSTDPVTAANQVIADRERQILERNCGDSYLHDFFLESADFRREVIKTIQAEINLQIEGQAKGGLT